MLVSLFNDVFYTSIYCSAIETIYLAPPLIADFKADKLIMYTGSAFTLEKLATKAAW